MKKKLLTIFGNKALMAAIATCALAAGIISSCTKTSKATPNYAAQFVGSWSGTTNCGGTTSSSTIVFGAGSGSNTLTTAGTVGNPGCVKNITATGTASSSGFTFAPQTFTDGCGLTYTITEAATLSGNTLSSTETVSGAVTATCTFTGTKQ